MTSYGLYSNDMESPSKVWDHVWRVSDRARAWSCHGHYWLSMNLISFDIEQGREPQTHSTGVQESLCSHSDKVEENEYETKKNNDEDSSSESSVTQKDIKEQQRECRICLLAEDDDSLVQPCLCKGSLQWAHVSCLQSWVHERRQLMCEICKSTYKEEYLPTLENAMYTSRYHNVSTTQSVADGGRRRRMLKTFVIVSSIVVALTAALVILGLNANDHTWAAIALRVLAFGLPMLIILRCILLWYQGRTIYTWTRKRPARV